MSPKDYHLLPTIEEKEDSEDQEFSHIAITPRIDSFMKTWDVEGKVPGGVSWLAERGVLPTSMSVLRWLLGAFVIVLMVTVITMGVALANLKEIIRWSAAEASQAAGVMTGSQRVGYYPALNPGMIRANFEIDGTPDYGAVSMFCDGRNWTQHAYVSCDTNSGGVGNVRNMVLACTRYAMQAGFGLVVPSMEGRGEVLSDLDTHTYKPFSYMFDENHFVNTLSQICPQMQVVRNISSIPDMPTAVLPPIIDPIDLVQPNGRYHNQRAGTFRHDVLDYIGVEPSAHQPVVVRLRLLPFEWRPDQDSIHFSAAFGRLLRFRDDVQILASKVLNEMNSRYSLNMNLTTPTPDIWTFAGAHLRTESDFIVRQTNYEKQTSVYFNTLKDIAQKRKKATGQDGYTHLFVASGNFTETKKFANDAETYGIKVFTKIDLLTDHEDLDYLARELTWDQGALVDYLVLLRSGWFMGPGLSSFSMNIAAKRHGIGGWEGKDRRMSWPRDEWSYCIGGNNPVIKAGLWP